MRALTVAVRRDLHPAVHAAVDPRAGIAVMQHRDAPWSTVHRCVDEHGEFHVATCTCEGGWAGREHADPDAAEMERLAHDDTHAGGQEAAS